MNFRTLVVLLVWIGLLTGCKSAPPISLEHYSDSPDYGKTPPIPQSGGSGPPEFQRVIEPAGGLTIPQRLPELLDAYRLKLIERAHPFNEALTEDYVEKEIAGLKARYSGNDEALREELTRRLRPVVLRPGTPEDVPYQKPRYPPEADGTPTEEGRRVP